MILDKLTEFCDATSVAAAAGTALVGSQIDLQEIGKDIGNGQPVYLVITVDTSIITAGAAGTVRFVLASDSTAAIAVDGTATEHWTSNDFITDDDALNALDAGATICVPLPLHLPTYERFLGILVVTATTTTTAGAISAFLTLDPKGYKAYPDGRV
jgi:hypothetical protein